MKICKIKNSYPVRFVKSLYHANKPIGVYKPQLEPVIKQENSFINSIKKLLNF